MIFKKKKKWKLKGESSRDELFPCEHESCINYHAWHRWKESAVILLCPNELTGRNFCAAVAYCTMCKRFKPFDNYCSMEVWEKV